MKKIFTFAVMCLLSFTYALADTNTYDCANMEGISSITGQSWSVTFGDFTMTADKATGSTNPTYNTTYKDIRTYAKNTLTITNSAAEGMTTIVFNLSTQGLKRATDVVPNAGATVVDIAAKTVTWTGDATASVTFTIGEKAVYGSDGETKAGQHDFTSVTITTGGSGQVVLATPTFSHAAGTYYTPFDLSLRCGTTGATIHYTLDGTEPTTASAQYSAPINIAATTTVKAIAALNGETSGVATAEYVMGTVTEVANVAAYKLLSDSTQCRFTDEVTVVAQNSNSLYVKDDSGYALFYGSTGKTYKNGDAIPGGFTGKKITYNGEPELAVDANSNFQDAASNNPVAPELIQVVDINDASMFGHYVVIKGANTSYQNKTITDNSGTASCYTGMGGFSQKGDSINVDVYGVIGAYLAKGDTGTPEYRILPTKIVVAGGNPDETGISIAEYQTVADNTECEFKNDVTVLAQKGSYLYVKDETGHMLIYGSVGKTYQQGDIIPAGFKGTKTTYNGEPELKSPFSGFKAASGNNPVTAEEIDLSAANVAHEKFGHYVVAKGVTFDFSATTLTDAAGNKATYYNSTFAAQLPTDASQKYNVYAIVGSHYNSSTKTVDYQILPVEVTLENGNPLPVEDVANIAALYAMPTSTKACITGEITAIYQNGINLYVKDDNTFALVYGKVDGAFVNGDKIKNAVASWVTYDGYKEIIPVASTWVKAGEGTAVTPEEMALEDLSQDMIHQYVTVPSVAITATETADTYTGNDGTIDLTIYNKYKSDVTVPATLEGKTFTVTGFVAMHSSKLQLIPISLVDENPGIVGDITNDGVVNVADVTALINMILAGESAGNADVNGDGEINVADVTALVNIILSNQ